MRVRLCAAETYVEKGPCGVRDMCVPAVDPFSDLKVAGMDLQNLGVLGEPRVAYSPKCWSAQVLRDVSAYIQKPVGCRAKRKGADGSDVLEKTKKSLL